MAATPHLDDLVGLDDFVASRARQLAPHPPRLDAFISGLAHQGLLTRPTIASALAPFMTLPKPEPRTQTRARMAAEIARAMSSQGCVTRDDLAGFTEAEITELFTEARRISGVSAMVA